MSSRLFKDIEEGLAREIRRIIFFEDKTQSYTILEETFDPFTGETIQTEVEPRFYDSSANARHIQYPHFYIKLLRSREDRFTGRGLPPYGKNCETQVTTSERAFEIILHGSGANIPAAGNDLETTAFKINSIKPGYLLRIQNGNNKGTYIVDSVTPNSSGPHVITVSNDLVTDLPSFLFNSSTRKIIFDEPVDLNTIEISDIFTDASSNTFNITAIDIDNRTITIDGSTSPDISSGSKINRSGDVFPSAEITLLNFLIMDPDKPISTTSGSSSFASAENTNVEIPIDAWYMIRIDSKDRDNHIDILDKMWEEFNPPRSALPVVRQTRLSAEREIETDIPTSGTDTLDIGDNSKYSIGDPVFVVDNVRPTKGEDGKFLAPLEAKIIDKIGTDQVKLSVVVPDSFKLQNCPKLISNAAFETYMFHFVDHVTKDIDGSQYWVHEFTFWVQGSKPKLETAEEYGAITDINTKVGDLDTETIILD